MPSYFVTGASRGIGFEFVKQLSADGSNVVFATVRNDEGRAKLAELGRSNVHPLIADITDYNSLENAARTVSSITGGKLDVLINNAAMMRTKNVGLTLETYSEMETLSSDCIDYFQTNVLGVINTIKVFVPLIERGTMKKIIVISTGIGHPENVLKTKYASAVPYSISKAAVNMAVAKFALAYEEAGIVFVALNPGLVKTFVAPTEEETERVYSFILAQLRRGVPDYPDPMSTDESVRKQLEVIHNVTVKDSGHLISYDGQRIG